MKFCGIIMPISARDSYTVDHWKYMLSLYKEVALSIEEHEIEAEIVSEAEDTGIIHQRIISTIFRSDILICDVSNSYPNVMFELGLAIAWDKPTIICKDNETGFNFDISPFEHLIYPKSRSYPEIDEFKENLLKKIKGTLSSAVSNPNYSPFLKTFLPNYHPKNSAHVSVDCLPAGDISGLRAEIDLVNKRSARPPFKEYKPQFQREKRGGISVRDREYAKKDVNEWLYENVYDGVLRDDQLNELVDHLMEKSIIGSKYAERRDIVEKHAIRALQYFGLTLP